MTASFPRACSGVDRYLHRATDEVHQHLRKIGLRVGLSIIAIGNSKVPEAYIFQFEVNSSSGVTWVPVAILTEDGKLRFLIEPGTKDFGISEEEWRGGSTLESRGPLRGKIG